MRTYLRHSIPDNGFTKATVLVLGDLMLDRYVLGEVTRISPEAPVPVLSVRTEKTVAGGAANVALNVVGLHARTYIAGVVGDDPAASRLTALLAEKGVDVRAVIRHPARPTTCKTRVVSGNHQIVRLDEETTEDLPPELAEELFQEIHRLLREDVDAIVLSDYGKGVLGAELVERVMEECLRRQLPVFVDPKRVDYTTYARATCITPNQKEFNAAVNAMAITARELPDAGRQLREKVNCGFLLITQGAHGMTLITSEQAHHFPALAQEVYDVSGAGDTVISTLAVAFASGIDLVTSVQLANIAASIVVRHAGTSPICWDSLRSFLSVQTNPNSQPPLGVPTHLATTAIAAGGAL